MDATTLRLETRLARNSGEVLQAQRLRYRVFVRELGGGGDGVDHARGIEADVFDRHAEHLLLIDHDRPGDQVVGVYRLMDDRAALQAGRFYCADEYDLSPLTGSGRRLMELGRSCLDADYRGSAAMLHLWVALAGLVQRRGIEILFGAASFHGTDLAALAQPLAALAARHLAPPDIRPVSRAHQPMDLVPADQVDGTAAMLATPALIKAYLRLGGFVGDGAFVDLAFNTTDVCLVLDIARMNPRQRAFYSRGLPPG